MNAKKSGFIFLAFIFLIFIFFVSFIGAAVSNVHTEPLYPNPSPILIKVYADVFDVSNATLYYRINENTYSSPFFISKGFAWLPPYEDVSNNVQVFYWVEAINLSGEKESTQEYSFTYDESPPVITITGDNPLTIEINSTYNELGATALDSVYGDLTSSINISGSIDTTILGEYFINYTVSDLAGNNATATRTVRVIEPAPVITENTGNSGGGSSSGGSGGGGNSYFYDNPVVMINETDSSGEETETPQNIPETNQKMGITGRTILGLGGSKWAGIIIIIVVIAGIVLYWLIKRRRKRKLYGKMDSRIKRFIDSLKPHKKKKKKVSDFE